MKSGVVSEKKLLLQFKPISCLFEFLQRIANFGEKLCVRSRAMRFPEISPD